MYRHFYLFAQMLEGTAALDVVVQCLHEHSVFSHM